jgi:hypothetical protein
VYNTAVYGVASFNNVNASVLFSDVVIHASPLMSTNDANVKTLVGLPQASVSVQCSNGTVGRNAHYTAQGTVINDTVIFATEQSSRLCPETGATLKGGWFTAAMSNGAAGTVTVKTRESVAADGAAYNGERPKLYVQQNWAAGVQQDTLLATATATGSGAFETLTSAIGPVSDDAVLHFYVSAGGAAYTQGWVNVDTVGFTHTEDTSGFRFWDASTGQTFVTNAASAEGGGGGGAWTYVG